MERAEENPRPFGYIDPASWSFMESAYGYNLAVSKPVSTGDALRKTQKWCHDLDDIYRSTVDLLDKYVGELEEDPVHSS